MNTMDQTEEYEEALIQIVRRLPPERASVVLDFAQVLEFQVVRADKEAQVFTEDDARWDGLRATEESQCLLESMADEVLSEIETGHARPMAFTEDGEILKGI